jgi:hypothetical protein
MIVRHYLPFRWVDTCTDCTKAEVGTLLAFSWDPGGGNKQAVPIVIALLTAICSILKENTTLDFTKPQPLRV